MSITMKVTQGKNDDNDDEDDGAAAADYDSHDGGDEDDYNGTHNLTPFQSLMALK